MMSDYVSQALAILRRPDLPKRWKCVRMYSWYLMSLTAVV